METEARCSYGAHGGIPHTGVTVTTQTVLSFSRHQLLHLLNDAKVISTESQSWEDSGRAAVPGRGPGNIAWYHSTVSTAQGRHGQSPDEHVGALQCPPPLMQCRGINCSSAPVPIGLLMGPSAPCTGPAHPHHHPLAGPATGPSPSPQGPCCLTLLAMLFPQMSSLWGTFIPLFHRLGLS